MLNKKNPEFMLTIKNNGDKWWEIAPFNKETNLKDMQKAVGGFIEHIAIFKDLENMHVTTWINESGKIKYLPKLIDIKDKDGSVIDYIAGNMVFTREKLDDVLPLSVDDIKEIINKKYFDAKAITCLPGTYSYFSDWFPGIPIIDME